MDDDEILEEYDIDAELELDELLAMDRQSAITSSTLYRAPSTAATTTILHLHQPRERRGNIILYDKTPTTSFSFTKVFI